MPTRDVIFNIIGRESVTPAANRAAASMEGAASRITRASDRMVTTGSALTHRLTLPLLAIGAVSIKMAADFNASMTRIQTQAGASARDVQYLTKQVLAMRNVQQGPTELANALYHLKSVGLANVPAMKALRQASDLAAVGHANLEDTTNALAGAWRTGIPGAKNFHQAVSTINAVIGAGNMTLADFNAGLGTGILPTAKTFGLTLKDVGSALALFTDEGVPADAAATRLRMSMSLLGAPSAAAEKQLSSIGLTGLRLANDMRKPNGLITAIGDLKSHLEDPKFKLSLSEQSQLLSHAFGGGRSSSAILSMINNFDVLKMKQDQVAASMGKFDAAVAAQRATPAAQFKEMEASVQRSLILLGTDLLPIAKDIANAFSSVAGAFNNLSPGTRKFILEVGLAAAAVGPLLLIGGKLIRVFGVAWRVMTFPSRILLGWGAAGRAVTATGTAATGSAQRVSLATLNFNASQLSQQSAAERAAAVIAVSEANKARAAVSAAETVALAARAAGGSESVLAERAATDARMFAEAKALEADAAVKSAATISVASMQATQALGQQQALIAGARRPGAKMQGLGMGLGFGALIAGQSVGGQAGRTLSDTGTGALIGSAILPGIGTAVGAGLGALTSVLPWSSNGDTPVPGFLNAFMGAHAIQEQVAGMSDAARLWIQTSPRYTAALKAAIGVNDPAATARLRNVTNGLLASAHAAHTAAPITEQLAHGTADLGKVADTTGRKIVSLADAITGLDHGMLGLANANLSFKIGLKDLPGQLNKHSKAITGDTKAALSNRQALVGLLGQVEQHASAMEQAGKKAPAVAKAIDGDVRSLEQVAIHAGVSRKAFESLIRQMHLTPKQVKTQLIADTTSAQQKIVGIQAMLNNLANGSYIARVGVAGPFGAGDVHITNPGRSGGGHFASGTGAGVLPQGWGWVGDPGPNSELTHTTARGTQVFTAPDSRRVAASMGIPVPGYAGGTGGPLVQRGGRAKLRLEVDNSGTLWAVIDEMIADQIGHDAGYEAHTGRMHGR